ncbi:unnamed protein product [Rhizophagus irregularis]|uniref:Uncharacterized protein n=1 Tax=Rhizophagus irregularis TaxID=588596 RepID=A0A2I1HDC2_9GLOM|nr:hypothetical protein RhiirA4_477519 [Rhizophagus irregularis]CAB4429396.1 unnamed protein product [Rhizophagus irregularis]
MLNVPNLCPFPDCEKNVKITEIFSTTVNYLIGRLPELNVIIQNPLLSQSSETLALTNMISKRFILTSPPMYMEGIENIEIQQMGSQLRCVKCFVDLSSYLPPLGFLRTFPYPPPKLLVYLTYKHIIHYNCINNPQKLCPICPSSNMEIDDLKTLTEQSSNTAQKKCTRVSSASTKKLSNKKVKKTGGKKVSSMLKKLIKELLANTPVPAIGENLEEANESTTSIFLQLSDKINNAETKNKELKLEHGKDGSLALVKSKIREVIPETKCFDKTLQKKMERPEKIYKLFNSIGKEKIAQIKSTPPGSS